MGVTRMLVRLAGWLAGGSCAAALTACYGAPPTPEPHDPTVVLQDFSYSPPGPIHVGDTLRLQATLNHSTQAGWLQVVFKKPELASVYLADDGLSPDAAPADGIYTADFTWEARLGDGKDLPVWAELVWDDGFEGQHRDAPPLTILPPEENGL